MQPLNTIVRPSRGSTIGCAPCLGQVDDRQPAVAEGDRPARPDALPVGAAAGWQATIRSTAARSATSPSSRSSPASPHILRLPSESWSLRSVAPMIQVSLRPPPREELTIMLPGAATRVRATGATSYSCSAPDPEAYTNARRSTWRGSSSRADQGRVRGQRHQLLGDPLAGVAGDLLAALGDLARRGVGTDQHASAALAVDRLGDQLAHPVEHLGPLRLVRAAVRRDRLQQGTLAEVELDQVRDVAVHRLLVGDAVAGRVGQEDAAPGRDPKDLGTDRAARCRPSGRRARRPFGGTARRFGGRCCARAPGRRTTSRSSGSTSSSPARCARRRCSNQAPLPGPLVSTAPVPCGAEGPRRLRLQQCERP